MIRKQLLLNHIIKNQYNLYTKLRYRQQGFDNMGYPTLRRLYKIVKTIGNLAHYFQKSFKRTMGYSSKCNN